MKPWLAKACLLAALSGPCWTTIAAALTPADAQAIHEAVQAQLDALSNDDAAGAFALTTRQKRQMIGNPDDFLRLIKEEYNPIYRSQRVIFSYPEVVDGRALQLARITDDYGKVWLAIFWMEQEDGGHWKIDGCRLVGTSAVSV